MKKEVETDFDDDSNYSESEKVPKKDKIQGRYLFLQNHPLYRTHQVSIITSNKLILNFVGGSLPRCDKRDREYYCTTMLTLFKLISLGMKPLQIISSLHINLMKFFNICYECIDARDDYSKLLKQKNASSGVFTHWFGSDDNDHLDDDNYDDGIVHEEYETDHYTSIGKKGQQKIEQMAEIQKIVTSAG